MNNELRTVPDLKGYLFKHIDAINAVAASTVTPERMVRLVCAAASREPMLAECTPLSIIRSLTQAAEIGLEVCSGANEAYLIPRWNGKARCREATFLPGYQGLIKLARESGSVRNIEARIVYANDTFDYELGLTPSIKHRPTLNHDRGDIVAVYAVAFLVDGGTQFEVMTRSEIDAIMNRAKDGKDGFSPWKSDYGEMARKTVVRRLAKYLPKKSKNLSAALEIQARAEAGEVIEASDFRPGEDYITTDQPTRILNEDGALEYIWTDSDRSEARGRLDDALSSLVAAGVAEADAEALCFKYAEKIGNAEMSPDTWNNRFLRDQGAARAAAKEA